MTYPDPRNGASEGPDVWLCADGEQLNALVTPDNGMSIHKRTWPDGAWTSHTFTGANATELELPVEDDGHNYCAVAEDGLGHYHVLGNSHAAWGKYHYLKTAIAGDITSFAPATLPGLPNAGNEVTADTFRLTYPTFERLNDGTLILIERAIGGSGGGDFHFWRRGPAATTWETTVKLWQGHAVSGAGVGQDWSAYPQQSYTDDNGRTHLWWMWRISSEDPLCFDLSYCYTDDWDDFYSIGGTLLTLPITPLNNPSCKVGLGAVLVAGEAGPGHNMVNGGGAAVDADGYPVAMISQGILATGYFMVRWNGSAWVETTGLHQTTTFGRSTLFLRDGHLWAIRTTTVGLGTRLRIVDLEAEGDGTEFGDFGYIGGEPDVTGWSVCHDPEAYRLHGTVEFSVPDGANPRVYRFTGKRLAALVA